MSHVTPFPDHGPGPAATPEGLIDAVVHLVSTGAVPLGAYTLAELTVVDAVVDFLEERPSDEVLGEAVRSLAARQLLVATRDSADLQVRGDLGIALAFQQRARRVVDIRVTGTSPGEPWRILLLPQPERITLEIRIDALGVHELGLYETEEAIERTADWLPGGDVADPTRSPAADPALAAARRSALVTLVTYSAVGTAEQAESVTDVVLAQVGDDLHLYDRDAKDHTALVPRRVRSQGPKQLLASLMG